MNKRDEIVPKGENVKSIGAVARLVAGTAMHTVGVMTTLGGLLLGGLYIAGVVDNERGPEYLSGGVAEPDVQAVYQGLAGHVEGLKDKFNEASFTQSDLRQLYSQNLPGITDYLRALKAECGMKDVDYCPVDVRERILGVYNGYWPSQAFLEWDMPRTMALVDIISTDPYLAAAEAGWEAMGEDARLEILDYILIRQIEVYGEAGFELAVPPVMVDETKPSTQDIGYYRFGGGEASIGIYADYLRDAGFKAQRENILHEGRHHIQRSIVRAAQNDVGRAYLEVHGIMAEAAFLEFSFDNTVQYWLDVEGVRAWHGYAAHEQDARIHTGRVEYWVDMAQKQEFEQVNSVKKRFGMVP